MAPEGCRRSDLSQRPSLFSHGVALPSPFQVGPAENPPPPAWQGGGVETEPGRVGWLQPPILPSLYTAARVLKPEPHLQAPSVVGRPLLTCLSATLLVVAVLLPLQAVGSFLTSYICRYVRNSPGFYAESPVSWKASPFPENGMTSGLGGVFCSQQAVTLREDRAGCWDSVSILDRILGAPCKWESVTVQDLLFH